MEVSSPTSSPQLFNSPLEAGLRVVIILEAFAPEAFDVATLSLLDYYVVHTADADAGAPDSIHPALETRAGEYFVRRRLVEEGAALMTRGFVIEQVQDTLGIAFRAREMAGAMIDLMSSDYNEKLKLASRWLADRAELEGRGPFLARLKRRLSNWQHEIVGEFPA